MVKNRNNSHKSAAMLLCMSSEELDKALDSYNNIKMVEHHKELVINTYKQNLVDLEKLIQAGEEMYKILKLVDNSVAEKACEHWRNCRL